MDNKKPYKFFTKGVITYFKVKNQIVGYYSYLSPTSEAPFFVDYPYVAVFIPNDFAYLNHHPDVSKEFLIGAWESYYHKISEELGDRNG